MHFVKAQHQRFWPSSGLFSSPDQFLMLPSCQHTLLVSGCPKNAHLDAAGGHSAGLRSLNHPACYAPEGASSTCCLLFRVGESTWAFFLLWNVMPSSLKASVLVTVLKYHIQLRFTPSFLQLTPFRWLDEALASLRWGLGADCTGSSLLVCCFSILKWLEKMGKQCFSQNAALLKLQMWKTFPSLYFQDRNLQSSFCSLVDSGLPFLLCASQSCHFCTQCCYSYILWKETKRIVHKISFMENLPGKSCPIFYRTTLKRHADTHTSHWSLWLRSMLSRLENGCIHAQAPRIEHSQQSSTVARVRGDDVLVKEHCLYEHIVGYGVKMKRRPCVSEQCAGCYFLFCEVDKDVVDPR